MATPTITSISPANALPGEFITISGTGLDQGAPTVKFGANVVGAISSYSPTSISFTLPVLVEGPYSVTVTNTGGVSTGFPFNVYPIHPTISSITANYLCGGTYTTINGTNFNYISAPVVIFKRDPSATPVTVFSGYGSTYINIKIPTSLVAGYYEIEVTNGQGGTGTSTPVYINAAASISQFSPTYAVTGTNVAITGGSFKIWSKGFTNQIAGITTVKIGGVNATSFTIASETQINAIVGSGAANGSVELSGNAGSVSKSGFVLGYTVTVNSYVGGPQVGISSRNYSIDNGATWIGMSLNSITIAVGTSLKFKGVFNSQVSAPQPFCEIVGFPGGDVSSSYTHGTTKTITTSNYTSPTPYTVSFNVYPDTV